MVAGSNAKTTPKVAAGKSGKPNKKGDGHDAGKVVDGISKLKIQEEVPRGKGLDVIKEFKASGAKKSLSFVVVGRHKIPVTVATWLTILGHVDAGKSTLMGRLLLELKHVEKHMIEKYRKQAAAMGKESFALAWVMDQGSEERARGVTIDIATNYFETEKTAFTILDAPGHRDFVPNMIAGASQADLAVVVIDSDTGAYEKGLKGQTREHILLLRSMGVSRLVIGVNKLDKIGWSQERFDEIQQQISGFVTGLGFQQKNIAFIPISGLNGDNLAKRSEDAGIAWYTGPTLLEAIEASETTSAGDLRKPFRMSVAEIYRAQAGNQLVAGRIESGTTQIGDPVAVLPCGETAHIKSIKVDKTDMDWAVAGQNVSITLTANADFDNIRVGDVLSPATNPPACKSVFTLKAMAFEHLTPMPIDLHRGRMHAAGGIASLVALLDKTSGEVVKKKPKIVQPGGVARIRVTLENKVPLEAGQRLVLRSDGETIAAGLVE